MNSYLTRFRESLADLKIITANLIVLIKATFFGVLSAEIWLFSTTFADKINQWVFVKNHGYEVLTICAFSLILLVTYLLIRGVFTDVKKIIKSGRLDIFAAFCFGTWLSVTWGGFLSAWDSRIIELLNIKELLTIVAGPFLLGILVIVKSVFGKEKEVESSFVVDLELEERKDDLLNFTEK